MKYKLIKEYKNSPKLGTVVTKAKDYNHYNYDGGNFTTLITDYFVENSPEFWEKVEDKKYKISEFPPKQSKTYSRQDVIDFAKYVVPGSADYHEELLNHLLDLFESCKKDDI